MLPEPMLLVSADGTIRAANAAFTRAFGWPRAEVPGRRLVDFSDDPPAQVAELLRRSAGSGQLLPASLRFRSAAGAVLATQCGGGVFRPPGGEQPALILLRLIPKSQGSARFVALTQKIDELTTEIGRRREAETAAASALASQHELRERLEAITDASRSLFASPSLDHVVAAIGALAERMIRADAFALWKSDAPTGEWRVVWQKNLTEGFAASIGGWRSPTVAVPEPLLVSELDRAPILAARLAAYAAEGIESVIIIPLGTSGEMHATVAAYFRRRTAFDDADRRVAVALGNLGSSALQMALLHDAQARSRRHTEQAGSRAAFLARAGSVLASSLDYEATLRSVAELAVPEIADWCAVDIVRPSGDVKRLAVAHVDSRKVDFARALRDQYPEDPETPGGVHDVIRRRQPVIVPRIDEAMLAGVARDERHLLMIRELGLASYMCVPLVAHDQALGALTFACAESGRTFGPDDLAFVEGLAARAALAVENADAYDQVQRANRLKDEFLATLSHELRTPLNAVLGYVRMLRTGALPDSRRAAALDTIERNASSLNQLVEDVLDVSRIEAGKIRLNVQPVDVAAVAQAAMATVAPAADARGVRLDAVLDGQVPPVSGDPERLQQIAWNLVSNAVKFTPRGGRVQVRVARIDSHVEIAVSDTGIGIAEEFLPHVFERFRQADSRFAREFGGLGLGLAITRHLVEMHGGTIVAQSEGRGRGTTFRVLLPPVIVHQRATSAGPIGHPRGCDEQESQPLADLAGVRVLVVDDDADALRLLCEVLEAAGAEVVAVTSGEAALAAIAQDTPDALVSDIGMPGMDGFDLIRQIRGMGDARCRNVPAAALTAYARSQDRTRALESGFHMHLAKPINPAELAAAVRALTKRASAV